MTYRTRKRLAIAILVLGLPAYVVVALSVVGMFDRPPLALEFAIYVGLGVLWAIPFRRVFLGLGRPDPDGGSDAGGPGHGGGGA